LNLLVIGGGGREHALAWKLAQSTGARVFVAPGNPGASTVATPVTGDYLELAQKHAIDLTIVGPEMPLVAGVVDRFRLAGRKIVGPTQAAAALEGSKIFAKDLMNDAGVPTARYQAFDSATAAINALPRFELPVVIKADGLAAGKGVVIAKSRPEAIQTIEAMFAGSLVGQAGQRVLLEDFCPGEEVSFIALCDGETALPLAPTQDHKAIFDGDQGPNTGGMGAYCDDRIIDVESRELVLRTVIQPTLTAMAKRGTPFHGFLYAGLMMTAVGVRVLEFNVRLGDPETQPILHRLDGDFAEVLDAAASGELRRAKLIWKPAPSVCVVLCTRGYPGEAATGDVIEGIAEAEATGAVVFQAGTARRDQNLVTSGGRVLGVTASGACLQSAIDNAYSAVRKIHFDGMQYRRDIGAKGLKRW